MIAPDLFIKQAAWPVLCCFSLVMPCLGQAPDLGEFEWRSRISGVSTTGTLHKARLPDEIFDGMRAFPLDARVVDADGMTWPSMIWARPGHRAIDPVSVVQIGRTETEAPIGFTVKKFRVKPVRPGGDPAVHNRVVVVLDGADFIRRVEVWGGPDENKLLMLGSGFLVEQGSPAPLRQRAIDYPDSTVPVLVVRVFHDVRRPDETFNWRTTDVVRVSREEADHEIVTLKKLPRPETEPPPGGMISLYVDTGARNRPLHSMTIPFSREGAAIPVRVFGRNDLDKPWRWVADGGLHHIAGLQQHRISLNRSDYRYLKVDLYVQDEKAIKIGEVTAEAIPYFLVFTPVTEKRAYLYFGAARYQLPQADFVRGVRPDRIDSAPVGTLSRREGNPARVASSLDAYGRTLLRFGLGVVVLLVALVSIRMVRHRLQK